jgi:RNA-directed DNA polymerase
MESSIAMVIRQDKAQKSLRQQTGTPRGGGEAPGPDRVASKSVRPHHDREETGPGLLHAALARATLLEAWSRVRANKGAAGVDGLTIEETGIRLITTWPEIREQILTGRYRPQPVRRVVIRKPDGGERMLGIPTVTDRLIQQALLQVLQPILDPTFSQYSYGFRPGRSAIQAVQQAQAYVAAGRQIVVDVDLEKFFDRVNHDVLMGRLRKRIPDEGVLRLIRAYLNAGIMIDGVVMSGDEGTPQGGPLSPLLANVLLDEVDRALERRGHCFVRYADDCNIYVRSQQAGERVMAAMRRLYSRLKLKINESKSAVGSVFGRKFLGYSFYEDKKGRILRRVADKPMQQFKRRVRAVTRRKRGTGMKAVAEELGPYLRGWKGYFRWAEMPGRFRELDGWVRHRLRALQLRLWARPAAIARELAKLTRRKDVIRGVLAQYRSWWRTSARGLNAILTNQWVRSLGVPSLA